MIAVVIPAHNEARRLGRCLVAMRAAVAMAEQAGPVSYTHLRAHETS